MQFILTSWEKSLWYRPINKCRNNNFSILCVLLTFITLTFLTCCTLKSVTGIPSWHTQNKTFLLLRGYLQTFADLSTLIVLFNEYPALISVHSVASFCKINGKLSESSVGKIYCLWIFMLRLHHESASYHANWWQESWKHDIKYSALSIGMKHIPYHVSTS